MNDLKLPTITSSVFDQLTELEYAEQVFGKNCNRAILAKSGSCLSDAVTDTIGEMQDAKVIMVWNDEQAPSKEAQASLISKIIKNPPTAQAKRMPNLVPMVRMRRSSTFLERLVTKVQLQRLNWAIATQKAQAAPENSRPM